MKAIWDRYHAWLKVNAPEVLASLRPGASAEQLRAAEEALGVTLPEDVKACYRIHDGQREMPPTNTRPGFLFGGCWNSLEAMVGSWRGWKERLDQGHFGQRRSSPRGPIQRTWWHPGWLPLVCDGAWAHHLLDLAPLEGGCVGQVISHQDGRGAVKVSACTFTSYLSKFLAELEAGSYTTYAGYHGLVLVSYLYG